jgi:SAM-dependent methyltransferase
MKYTTKAEFREILLSLIDPWLFMASSLYYLPGTILSLMLTSNFSALLSWSRIRDAWFSRFWTWAGPNLREGNGPRIIPLFEGRVSKGQVVSKPVVPPVGGVVLDLGPGSGYWVDLFAKFDSKAKVPGQRVGKKPLQVYGIEPNRDVHAALSQRVSKAGLDGVYEIVPAGVESLAAATGGRIEKGSVDCIVSILCLCGIPEPEANIQELYSYLKKGGRWYFYEHVQVNKGGGAFMKIYQGMIVLRA